MGWDVDRFPEGEVNLDLICCICTNILEDPVESPCRHVFCSQCIKTWLSNQKTCPHCRAPVHRKDLQGVVPLLKSIICKQKIYCDHREKGCEEIVALEMLQSHVAVCNYGMAACPNDGCGLKVLRKDLRAHSDVCPKRTVLCDQGCEMLLTLGEKNNHNCIQALQRHFEERTNDMLSRISKLEELVNVLVSKSSSSHSLVNESRQDNTVHASTSSWPPYTIPSPRPSQTGTYAVLRGNIPGNNDADFSDSADSGSDSNNDIAPRVDTVRPRGRYGITSPVYYHRYTHERDYDRDDQRHLDERVRQRSRSPVHAYHRNNENIYNERRNDDNARRSAHRRVREIDNDRHQRYQHASNIEDEPLVLHIGVTSETVSESSPQSTSSDSDTD